MNYEWKIEELECKPILDSNENIVNNIHWRVNATDGVNNATVYGTQTLEYAKDATFISYPALTKDVVIEWVKNAMGAEQVLQLEKNLDNQLYLLANPPVVILPLPWSE